MNMKTVELTWDFSLSLGRVKLLAHSTFESFFSSASDVYFIYYSLYFYINLREEDRQDETEWKINIFRCFLISFEIYILIAFTYLN